jgi:hypothetical protein
MDSLYDGGGGGPARPPLGLKYVLICLITDGEITATEKYRRT